MRSALHIVAAAAAVTLLSIQPMKAETTTADKALEALFKTDTVDTSVFRADFLAKVPAAEVTQRISDMKRDYGPLIGVSAAGNGFMLRFEHVEVPARIILDAEERIIGLWFGPLQGDIDALVAAIKALPGRTSLLIATDGKPVASYEADTPLAVGSAAKLAILLAVKNAIAEKRFTWDTVVELDPGWKSLPSSQLRDWPDRTPLTIATLANLMISISDNTATDALIRILGRESVDAISPRNAPFPTTRELFTLKTQENAPLRAEWRTSDAAHRRAILDRLANTPVPPLIAVSPAATHEVEWFLTAHELCDLLDATADMPSTSINPGLVDRDYWQNVAYKGGSEVGVYNVSSRLTDKHGRVHCVVATWNGDGTLDKNRLIPLYQGLVRGLGTQH
ncbi:serine hydrolase [Bradyrhizobium sp. 142]|uniref:serine hydrolase n=1 Tax=Bradyrhizobium sp. 142 TaxID=2782618 RepID=UPI001FF7AF0D|nr:serine hydrolase [Bradyrhizobium sp. 142]MCK1727827.1 serine hydrolase [Bradyrhizobium sp. 142]